MPRPRLLICDDDEPILTLISTVASGIGFEVRCCSDALSLDTALADWIPDVLILDLNLVTTDGIEVLKTLVNHGLWPRLILISGIGGKILESARRTAEAYGFSDVAVLPKPFLLGDLETLLRHAARPDTNARMSAADREEQRVVLSRTELEQLIAHDRIRLVYQPKMECFTGQITGYEVLSRLQREDGSEIMPLDFIPLTEESGFIDILTKKVCEEAIRWLAQSFGDTRVDLAINLSAKNLHSGDLIKSMLDCCKRYAIRPERVILELTEGIAVSDDPEILGQLIRMRMSGFRLSIDDFGTGYSSMLLLVKLPFTELKIDQAFIRSLGTSHESEVVVKTAIDLARQLELSVVAEGVEDAKCLTQLCRLGVAYVQGYYIAPPMPGDKVVAWTRERMRLLEPAWHDWGSEGR